MHFDYIIEKAALYNTAITILIPQQLRLLPHDLHKTGPVTNKSWVRKGLTETYSSLMDYWILGEGWTHNAKSVHSNFNSFHSLKELILFKSPKSLLRHKLNCEPLKKLKAISKPNIYVIYNDINFPHWRWRHRGIVMKTGPKQDQSQTA